MSGIRSSEQFTRLRGYLRAFTDLDLVAEDYELAAEFDKSEIQGADYSGAVD